MLRSDSSTAYEIGAPIKSFSWHPFANIVAIADEESSIRILNGEAGEEIQKVMEHGHSVAWSPDGTNWLLVEWEEVEKAHDLLKGTLSESLNLNENREAIVTE